MTAKSKILIVDDDPQSRQLYISLLTPFGHQVLEARDGREGLEVAKQEKPDLILPHEDGYDFLRMVQVDPELANIPFVLLSSSVWSTREQEIALMRGAKKFISRPIEPQDLLAEIEACLAAKEGGPQWRRSS